MCRALEPRPSCDVLLCTGVSPASLPKAEALCWARLALALLRWGPLWGPAVQAEEELQRRCVTTVQAVWRARGARLAYRHLLSELRRVQRAVRVKLLYPLFRKRRLHGLCRLQATVRMALQRRRYCRLRATKRWKRAYAGVVAWRHLQRRACTEIQRHFRGYRAWLQYQRVAGAALEVHRVARGFLARRRCHRMRLEIAMSCKLQGAAQTWLARRELARRRRLQRDSERGTLQMLRIYQDIIQEHLRGRCLGWLVFLRLYVECDSSKSQLIPDEAVPKSDTRQPDGSRLRVYNSGWQLRIYPNHVSVYSTEDGRRLLQCSALEDVTIDGIGYSRSSVGRKSFSRSTLAVTKAAVTLQQSLQREVVVTSPVTPGHIRTYLPNGTRIEAFPGGGCLQTEASGITIETCADTTSIQTSPDGIVLITFPDGSKEKHVADEMLWRMRRVHRDELEPPCASCSLEHVEVYVLADGCRVQMLGGGRKLTVHPDGRSVEHLGDGRVVQTSPDGVRVETGGSDRATVTRFANGDVVTEHASGHVTTIKSGSNIQIDKFPDGRIVQVDPDGTRIESFPDGRHLQTNPCGTTIETLPNRTTIQTSPDGMVLLAYADGSKEKRSSDALLWRMRRVHRDELEPPCASCSLEHVEVYVLADGCRVQMLGGGRKLTVHPDGRSVEHLGDGRVVQTSPDGVRVETGGSDRATVTRFANGDVVTEHASGHVTTIKSGSNIQIDKFPDGRIVQVNADGTRILRDEHSSIGVQENPDGSRIKRHATEGAMKQVISSGIEQVQNV
ncbi:hypothetical protein CYMTET_11899 [Cymbomonas tetramitiformis]|uniref:Centromere protein J C-terminal domain-containing protein n=1 Tax=Cymbomonas tetramitiformis TaxID=36881 RepID=A0AAE0LD07_9CHLO|nr:hypothetical protein CYMTET_11899 [Cymbomonas tetramitiformis]